MATSQYPPLSARTLVVYPTGVKARAVARAQAQAGNVVLGDVVTTFPELTDRLATDLGLARDVLSPPLARIVIRSVARERHPKLGERRGLVNELHDVIEELTAAHLDAADVHAIAGMLGGSEAGLRLNEIADVYSGYQEALGRLGVTDRHGRTRAVADRLAATVLRGQRPDCLAGVERIVFAEIYDYSVAQFLLATALIRLVGDAELVAFAHPENVEATRFLDRTWNRFVSTEPIAEHVLPSFVRRDGRTGGIATLLAGAFAGERPAPSAPDDSVRLLVAPHRYGEAEATLRLVRERIRTGTPPERIAVLARDMTQYRDALVDVSRRFDVPLEMRPGTSTLAAGSVRFVLDLWHLAAEGLPRVPLASALDSDYASGTAGQAADLLARVGYVDDRIASVEACVQAAEQRGRVVRFRPRWAKAIRAIRGLEGPATVREHVRRMSRALAALRFGPVAREAQAPNVAERDARGIAALVDTVSELATLDRAVPAGPVGPQDVAEMVAAILADRSAPHSAMGAAGVRALSVQDARGLDFDSVFVLGMDDGTLPCPRRESVLLPDWVRREVNSVAGRVVRDRLGVRAEGLPLGSLLRTSREAQLEEPFLFFLACSMATRELVLVRPMADGRGTPCVPSPFLAEVAACFDRPLTESVIDASESVPSVDRVTESRELIVRRSVERWRGDGTLASRLDALLTRTPETGRRLADIDRRVQIEVDRLRYFLTPGDVDGARAAIADRMVGRLSHASDAVRAQIADRSWSPTAIERLAACGFKCLAADVLRLSERREPEADADPLEGGTLLHAAVEAVLASGVLPQDPSARRSHVGSVLDRERQRILESLAPKEQAATEARWRRIAAAVLEIADIEADRWAELGSAGRTSVVEWEFETREETDAGPRLHGRADLIDVVRQPGAPTRVIVTDYKSSRDRSGLARRSSNRALGVSAFQLPVYLEAARRAFAAGEADVVLEGRVVAAFAPPRDKVAAAVMTTASVGDAMREIDRLIDAAAGGRFDVDPAACDEWCRFRSVCRYVRPPTEEGDG